MFGRLDEHSFGVNRRASGQSSGRPVRTWIGGRLGTPLPRTYRRIFGTLITLVRDRATAEDCAQETYERAYRGWAKWRPDAPVEAWLHRIAINMAISDRRHQRPPQAGAGIRRPWRAGPGPHSAVGAERPGVVSGPQKRC